MPRGNISAVRKWQQSLTPEARRKWRANIKAGRARAKALRIATQSAQLGMNGVAGRVIGITINEREEGGYKKGSSRTIVLQHCPYDTDGVMDKLLPRLRDLRSPDRVSRRSTPVIDLAGS
jgi:hypothetical protein